MKKKMSLLVIMTISMILMFSSCTSDENTISGYVNFIDVDDNEEYVMEGIKVYLMEEGDVDTKDADNVTQTNKNGYYTFDLVEDGTYYLYAEFTDILQLHTYKGKSETVKVKGKDAKQVDLTLK